MSMFKRLSQWWRGHGCRAESDSTAPQPPSPPSQPLVTVPQQPAGASPLPPEIEEKLNLLKEAYRKERAAQMIPQSNSDLDRALGDLRDFYVTTGLDIAELDRLVAEVDFDLFRDYSGG